MLCLFNSMCAIDDGRAESEIPIIEHIIANEEGVFLQVGNTWIATEGLQVSSGEIFVLIEGEWMTISEAVENPDCARATWKCEVCGFINYDGIAVCGVCGTPRPPKKRS